MRTNLSFPQLIAHVATKSMDLLRSVSSRSEGGFPTYKEVNDLVCSIERSEQPNADLISSAQKLDDAIKRGGTPELAFFSKDLMQRMDEHAVEEFKGCEMTLGLMDDQYINSLRSYVRAVLKSMDELQDGHPLLDTVKAKFFWATFNRPGGR